MKIVTLLFKSTWLNFIEAENRAELLQHGTLTRRCTLQQLYNEELPVLDNGRNYWVLFVKVPMGNRFQVYDCQYPALRELIYLSSGQDGREFCVVDKKYAWLLLFRIDRMKDMVEIYRAPSSAPPEKN
ncbi:hypothetical protein [Chitinophaga eiseniae]|nr:hypothetical protein [Chitinophaga eiseniae]